MTNNLKRQVIHHLAEQGIPADYAPWEAVKTQLERRQAGRKTMGRSKNDSPSKFELNMRFTGVLTLLLVLLVSMVFFLTPPGQVTAKNLFQLFRRADSNVLPLPAGQPTEPIRSTRTPVPTRIVGVQSVLTEETSTFVTPTPKAKTESGTITNGLSISEAEALANYTIWIPKSLPSGYQLAEISYESQAKLITQIYKYSPYQSGEMFILHQQLAPPTDPIGLSAEIEQIPVGDTTVEAVSGAWFTAAGSSQKEWLPDAPVHTFRWQQDGFTFTLQFLVGDTFSPAYLSKEDMQAVLETVIGTRSALSKKVNLTNLASIEEVEQAAGIDLLAPTLLPKGFVLERAVYEPENKRAVFIYRPKDTGDSMDHPSLIIYEILQDRTVALHIAQEEVPQEAVDLVTIGTTSGTFQRGAMVNGAYDLNMGSSLYWETKDLYITIWYFGSPLHPAQLEKADMIKVAESLR